jgi:alanine racemase
MPNLSQSKSRQLNNSTELNNHHKTTFSMSPKKDIDIVNEKIDKARQQMRLIKKQSTNVISTQGGKFISNMSQNKFLGNQQHMMSMDMVRIGSPFFGVQSFTTNQHSPSSNKISQKSIKQDILQDKKISIRPSN